MKIKDTIDDFINYCVFEKGLSNKTKESYTYDLKIYSSYLNEQHIHSVEEITEEHITGFLKERSENKEAISTIAHNLTVIKNFHSYLLKTGILKPAKNLI